MTRDDVIRWAREAELTYGDGANGECCQWKEDADLTPYLERFAALVAAAERRKHQSDVGLWKAEAAKAEMWRGLALGKDPMHAGKVVQQIQHEAMAMEREACAKECERVRAVSAVSYETGSECAKAIRARGSQ